MKNMEILGQDDLLDWDTRESRGHGKKLRKDNYRRDVKRNSFPHRVLDVWNELDEEVVCAETIHDFKTNLDKMRYRDGTMRA